MWMTRLSANLRLPYACAETKPTPLITTTASNAIAKRRRNEKTEMGGGTRPPILLTQSPNFRTPYVIFTRVSLHRESQAPGQHDALDFARSFTDLENLGVAVE